MMFVKFILSYKILWKSWLGYVHLKLFVPYIITANPQLAYDCSVDMLQLTPDNSNLPWTWSKFVCRSGKQIYFK